MVTHGKTVLFAAIAGVTLVGAACSATVTDSADPGGNGGSDAGGTGANAGHGGTEDDALCPAVPPDVGTPCGMAELECGYGAGECFHQARCIDGLWNVTLEGDCAATCPAEVPIGGCSSRGLTCTYELGATCGAPIIVECIDETWVVTSTPCEFSCPDDAEDLPTPCDSCCHHPCSYNGPVFCDEWEGRCEADGTWSVVRPIC